MRILATLLGLPAEPPLICSTVIGRRSYSLRQTGQDRRYEMQARAYVADKPVHESLSIKLGEQGQQSNLECRTQNRRTN